MNAVTQEFAQLQSRAGVAATLQSVQMVGQVEGLLLTLSIRQHYKNSGANNLEAVYTFPLPWGATLLGLNAEIDGHRLQGTVLERKQASERYEKAIDEGDTPIMVERSASGLYTANLGNLKPGESAVIEIEYAQWLRFEQGQVRITVPTTVAPRYGDAHAVGGLAPHESVATDLLVQYPLLIELTLRGPTALAAVQCPSHAIDLTRQDDTVLVSLSQGGYLDRDFVLLLANLQGQSFATFAPDGDGFVVQGSFCPTLPEPKREPLALKVLVDCSGSMNGDSIDAARRALHEVLKELNEEDWISYSRFGSTVEHDLPELVPCKAANLKRVAQCIANTQADLGGTEMNTALVSTFHQRIGPQWRHLFGADSEGNSHHNVLLITDGDIWDIENVIASAKTSENRVFAIGVGSAPGESLLREMADQTGGACELAAPEQNVAEVIVRMFRRMRSARCTHIKVDWGQPVQWQSALPSALYGGDTLHLSARVASLPLAAPTLSWLAKQTEMQSRADSLAVSTQTHLPRLVAAQEIKELDDTPDNQARLLELALQYQLVSKQTNLLLVHTRAEGEKAEGLPALEKVAHMQAAGWGGVSSVRDGSHFSIAFSNKAGVAGSISASVRWSALDNRMMSTPTVWRTASRRTAPPLSPKHPNVLAAIDDFEIPAFLRKAADGGASQTFATPVELVKAFDTLAGTPQAEDRVGSTLAILNLPARLIKLVRELAVELGSNAKAWAIVVQWAVRNTSGMFSLSRQGERLLRHLLQGESAAVVDALVARAATAMGAIQINDCSGQDAAGLCTDATT